MIDIGSNSIAKPIQSEPKSTKNHLTNRLGNKVFEID